MTSEEKSLLEQSNLQVGACPLSDYFFVYSGKEQALKACIKQKQEFTRDLRLDSDRLEILGCMDQPSVCYPDLAALPDDFVKSYNFRKKAAACKLEKVSEIPFDPPHIPANNPVALFHKYFTAQDLHYEYHMQLSMQAAAFYIWLNGTFIGFSQVTGRDNEFLLSPHVIKGINHLTILATAEAFSSYLHINSVRDLRINDLVLVKRPQAAVTDVMVETELIGENSGKINVKITPSPTAADAIEAASDFYLLDDSGQEIQLTHVVGANGSNTFEIANVAAWSWESPRLYYFLIDMEEECLLFPLNFQKITAVDGIVEHEGQALKVWAVNSEILLCPPDLPLSNNPKVNLQTQRQYVYHYLQNLHKNNFNSISSRVMYNQMFRNLCLKSGIRQVRNLVYTADLQKNSASPIAARKTAAYLDLPELKQAIMQVLTLEVSYKQNNILLYLLDYEYWLQLKNSLPEAADKLSKNSLIALTAPCSGEEGEINVALKCLFNSALQERLLDEKVLPLETPYYLASFADKLGEEEIAVNEVLNELTTDSRCLGAAVNDFALPGKNIVDFNEITGMRYTLCPLTVRVIRSNNAECCIYIYNNFAHACTQKRYSLRYELTGDGKILQKAEIFPLEITSGQMTKINVPGQSLEALKEQYSTLTLNCFIGCSEDGRHENLHKSGLQQFIWQKDINENLLNEICEAEDVLPLETELEKDEKIRPAERNILIFADGEHYLIQGSNIDGQMYKYIYSCKQAIFTSMIYDNCPFLSQAGEYSLKTSFLPAGKLAEAWEKWSYDSLQMKVYKTEAGYLDELSPEEMGTNLAGLEGVYVKSFLTLSGPDLPVPFTFESRWIILASGRICWKIIATKHTEESRNFSVPLPPPTACIGVKFYLPASFNECRYYAYGPQNSYCNKLRHTYMSLFTHTLSEKQIHYGTQALAVNAADGNQFIIWKNSEENAFSFICSQETAGTALTIIYKLNTQAVCYNSDAQYSNFLEDNYTFKCNILPKPYNLNY